MLLLGSAPEIGLHGAPRTPGDGFGPVCRGGQPQPEAHASRSRSMRFRIAANSFRGTATSAIWKMTYLEWATTFAPILISFSRSVVSVQLLIGLRQHQLAEEVGQVVRQGEQLQPRRVVLEPPAGQLRPLHRVLAFLDPLLRRAALVVEVDDLLRVPLQVGDDEADAREQFAGVPGHPDHDAAGALPRTGLIAEAAIEDLRLVRKAGPRDA